MAGSTIIALEGVLRADTGAPIREGILIYRALCETTRVSLALDDLPLVDAQHWLRVEGMNTHGEVIEGDPRFTGLDLRREQLERARNRGSIDLLIDDSPNNVAMALKAGVAGLLFTQPYYARQEFRPDTERDIRPWSEITSEISRQKDMLTRDERLTVSVVSLTD